MIVLIIAPKSDSWKQSGVYNNTALHMFVLCTSPSEFQSLYTLEKFGECVKDLRIAVLVLRCGLWLYLHCLRFRRWRCACCRLWTQWQSLLERISASPTPSTYSAKPCWVSTYFEIIFNACQVQNLPFKKRGPSQSDARFSPKSVTVKTCGGRGKMPFTISWGERNRCIRRVVL